jgi:hypothetical protein
MASIVLQVSSCLLVALCLLFGEAAALFLPDGRLSITLSFVDNFGNPFHNRTCDNATFTSSINELCTLPLGSYTEVRGSNSTSCMFVIIPPDVSGDLAPCFEAVISTPWTERFTVWQAVTNPMPKGVGIIVTPSVTRITIGMFSDDDYIASGTGYFKVILVACLGLYIAVCVLHVWDSTCGTGEKIRITTGLGQVLGCTLVVCAAAVGITFYFVATTVTVPPLISTGSTTTAESCFVHLQDITPWELSAINADTFTFTNSRGDAKVQRDGNDTQVIYQWPCKIHLFYNPYDVEFSSNGERVPLTFSITSSSLVVQSFASVAHVPLVVRSTSSQLAANRVYLSSASFFSIDVSLVSGIAYVASTVTHSNQTIEINATSVFVVSGQSDNLKSVDVTHVANPPLYCIGPKVAVTFNASACTSSSGTSTSNGGGNETYVGINGYCTLQARDSTNASDSLQHIIIRAVSFYMLPSAPAPISGKSVGAGFENPPGLSENIIIAINTSKTWVSSFSYDSFVQNIDVVTPLLGIKLLNTNFPSTLQFFPELIKWFTAFVLSPPYRTLQAVPDHFTCDDDITIEGLVPPTTTLIMYLNGDDLTDNDERFAVKVLTSTFSAIDSSSVPGSLTSFQLPMEAWNIRPSLRRETFVNSRQVTIARPPIADLLIGVSAILAFLLICAIAVLFLVFGKKIYNFLAWSDKRDLVAWAITSMEKARTPASKNITAKDQSIATEAADNEDPSSFCGTLLTNVWNFFVNFWSFISSLSRALNGLSYRMTLKTTNSLRTLWASEHESLESFLQVYVEFHSSTGEDANFRAITVEELTIMYRSFCKIFDRLDGEEYKKESLLRKCIGNVAVKMNFARNYAESQRQFCVQDGYARNLRMKLHPASSSVTMFEVDVREVKRMIEANNLIFSFGASRTSTCDPWYDRMLRHPILLGGTQTFYYCFLQLTPIAVSIFCLFALQLAMVDYQITGVLFRDSDTAAAYLISFFNIGEWTMQVVVLWIFYGCGALVLFERLLQAWGAFVLHMTSDKSDLVDLLEKAETQETLRINALLASLKARFSGVKFIPPSVILSAAVRFFVFVPYIFCTLFMFGYILLVALWWILTCFLAPNVMIPFAASGLSLLSSLYGVYRSLKGCKQKLIDYINVKIETEVNRFLQAIRIDFSDDNNVVIGNETSDDFDSKAKFIASTSQIPLPVVEFALNPRDDDARLRLVQFFAPLSSPEFQTLLSFSCSTTTDVDDVGTVAKPFVDALLPQQGKVSDGDASSDKSSLVEANRGLVLSLLHSLILPQPDGGCLNNAAISRGVVRAWKSDILDHIDTLLANGKREVSAQQSKWSARELQLGALRQLVIGVEEFLKTRQLQIFCDRVIKLLPLLLAFTGDDSDLPPYQSVLASCRVALPIVGKLAWLFADSIATFEESFNFILLALPNEQRQTMEGLAMSVAATLQKTALAVEEQERDAIKSRCVSDNKKQTVVNATDTSALEMSLLPLQAPGGSTHSSVTESNDCKTEADRFGRDGALLYAALTAVADRELVWSVSTLQQSSDDLTKNAFCITSLMQSPPKDENSSLRAQWATSLRRGSAWPTLELDVLFPSLSQIEYATLRNFSLAGINPGSFFHLTGWKSFTSVQLVQRETKCLAAWIQNVSDDPSTFQFAAEAYFYHVVWEYLKRNGRRDDLLNRCMEVSCPLLLGCMEAMNAVTFASLDEFVAKYLKKSSMLSFIKQFEQCAVPIVTGTDWIECCRNDCTPMFLLCTADPKASLKAATSKSGENHLEELRRHTGFRVAFDNNELLFSANDVALSTLESVFTVATMQQHAPEAVIRTLGRLEFRAGQSAPTDLKENNEENFTPKDLVVMPMCGIGLLARDLAEQALAERRNAIVVASAMLRVPLFAYAASLTEARIKGTSRLLTTNVDDLPVGAALIRSVLAPSKSTNLESKQTEPRFIRKAFSHLPTVMSLLQGDIAKSSFRSASNGVGQQVAGLVAALDIIGGECLRPQDETKLAKYGIFVPQSFDDVARLVDIVVGTSAAGNDMVNLLKIVLAVASGSGDLEHTTVVPTLTHLSSIIKAACGVDLLPPKYVGIARFFARQDDGDVFGLLNECITPLLSVTWTSNIPPFAFAMAHVARVHKYKRRPSALLEIFREHVDQITVLTTKNPIFMVPATPVERWLISLQRYASEGSISHLQAACTAAIGSQYTTTGWNVLLHHVELQKCSGKKRAIAIASTFKATVATVPKEKVSMLVDRLKRTPLFAPLADKLEELLKPDQTLDHLGEKLVDSVKQYIINSLHISSSDIVRILLFVGVMLTFLVSFILLGIVAFSNGSTFSSLIGVAFPVVGGSMSQYDSASFFEGLKEKADEIIEDLSGGTAPDAETKQKQD